MGRLDGKVAIITGAGSGIGRGGAVRFAAEGAKVVIADIRQGDRVEKEIRQASGEATYLQTDVGRSNSVEAMVKQTLDRYARIDILWSNAGVQVNKPVHTTTDEEYDRVMGVNLRGLFHCARAIVPHMIEQRSGAILSTASVDGLIGERDVAVYSATKGAILSMTRSMAADYAQYGIRVNAISPGWIDTPINDPFFLDDPAAKALAVSYQPVGRLGLPEDIAACAVFLCSDEAGFVTGSNFVVDGGFISTWLETPPETGAAAS